MPDNRIRQLELENKMLLSYLLSALKLSPDGAPIIKRALAKWCSERIALADASNESGLLA